MDSAVSSYSADLILPSLKRVLRYVDMRTVEQAYHFAEELYGDDRMEIGDIPLMEHVYGVLNIFLEFCPEEEAIVACLLQHALQNKRCSPQEIEKRFGKAVRTMVSRLHLLSHVNSQQWQRSIEDMKTMLVSVSDDTRILLLHLCVQCYLLDNIQRMPPTYRTRIAREALQIFAPVAARLGIYMLKYRLEDRAFPISHPADEEGIQAQLQRLHGEHGPFLPAMTEHLRTYLAAEHMEATVIARQKHSYSIFRKMRRKSLMDISKISDLFALRVVVHTTDDCYQVLGLLHRLGKPISHRFKDYISFPKPNGYQSLHTCLIGLPFVPRDLVVEVQIRTETMHREAEYGIAAHWMYKEGKGVRKAQEKTSLSNILLAQHDIGNDDGADTSVRLVDHIYVLTPKGDIRELPKGATPLDFAFLIHTDIGLKYKGARVNGVIAPISHKLENGDIVEVFTHQYPRPSLHWLDRLATSSARAKLKNYFFAHNRPEFLTRGRQQVNAAFATLRIDPLDNDLSQLKVFDEQPLSVHEREDLLVKVGMGSVKAASLIHHLQIVIPPTRAKARLSRRVTAADRGPLIEIEGSPLSMTFRFAKCCAADAKSPRPDTIVGFVTRTGEMSVHQVGCGMLKGANKERMVKVRWTDEKSERK